MKVSEIASKLQNIYPVSKFMDEPFTPMSEMMESSEVKHAMEYLCFFIQSLLCSKLEKLENGMKFKVDRWKKSENTGGGVTCVMQDGGVNISVITGPISEANRQQMASRGHEIDVDQNFSVVGKNIIYSGISSVIHPRNPHIPTMHFNFRYFEVLSKDKTESKIFWFGGGCDITPNYLYPEKFKDACDAHDVEYYPKFKKWADNYFYISHRGKFLLLLEEHRGLGGIFFDDLTGDKLKLLNFVIDSALAIYPAYIPIIEKRVVIMYTNEENEWKLVRRGRGTKFGFNVPGSRIESILMSLPATAKWIYCHEPKPGSREEELMKYIKHPIDWVLMN